MSTQTTQIPSPFTAMLKALSDQPDAQKMVDGLSKSVMAIGSALAAAGVGIAGGGNDPATLGGLVVDASIPKAIAVAQGQEQDTGRIRSLNA